MKSILDKKELKKLIQKFLDGKATEEETRFLQAYYAYYENEPNILDSFSAEQKTALSGNIENKIQCNIHGTAQPAERRVHVKRKPYQWAAAAIILVLVSAGYIFIRKEAFQPGQTVASRIVPGHDGAILTLSNGTQILLDSADKGNVAVQGNINIINRNGEITYQADSVANTTAAVAYNTLETSRGMRFKIVLPDGTQVWLNSASSLKYPTAFAGGVRNVQLTGEAYFEVVHNAAMPFIVRTGRTDVRVLGTGFNVMAYSDESSEQTTLVHGLVRVSSAGDSTRQSVIRPGQQAVLLSRNDMLTVRDADTAAVLAWMNGDFIFGNNSIKYVMRQLARWYDVSVQYQGNVDNVRFEGMLSRRSNFSDILGAIEATNEVHFKIEGKAITVIAGR